MKRTLGLLIAATACAALAQTPTVVEKPASKATTPASKAAAPAPGTVKAVSSAAAKPAVAPPAAKPQVSVVAAKVNAAPASKPAVALNAKPAATTTTKPAAATTTKPAWVAGPSASHPVAAVASKTVAALPKAEPARAELTKKPAVAAKSTAAPAKSSQKPAVTVVKQAPKTAPVVAVQEGKKTDEKKAPRVLNASARRDPFTSPVVNMGAVGSGCSTGKRCLTIDQIALRGVVKSDTGMIAVVVNAMDKAYFLRENDPVFNGYVVKITGDSIVFKETFHDRLGKALTRDVTKSISRPSA